MKAAATGLAAFIVATPAAAQAPAWQPDVAAAIAYASHRHGTIAFAVRRESGSWGRHASRTFPSASVLKAMLLVAYLDLPSVRAPPTRPERPHAARADDPTLRKRGGRAHPRPRRPGRLRALAHRAGMRRFTPVTGIWGLSRVDSERVLAAGRGEVLVVGRARPAAAPLPADGRERAHKQPAPDGHPAPHARAVEVSPAGARMDAAVQEVRVLDWVDVDREAVRMRRPALRPGGDRVAAVEGGGVVGRE